MLGTDIYRLGLDRSSRCSAEDRIPLTDKLMARHIRQDSRLPKAFDLKACYLRYTWTTYMYSIRCGYSSRYASKYSSMNFGSFTAVTGTRGAELLRLSSLIHASNCSQSYVSSTKMISWEPVDTYFPTSASWSGDECRWLNSPRDVSIMDKWINGSYSSEAVTGTLQQQISLRRLQHAIYQPFRRWDL